MYIDLEAAANRETKTKQPNYLWWFLGLLLLLLLLIGAWLFAGFYAEHESNELDGYLKNSVRLLNLEIAALNLSISGLPHIYEGNPYPNPTLGPTGSIYLQPNTSLIYYKVNSTSWILATNATSGLPGPPGDAGSPGADGDPGSPGLALNGTWSGAPTTYKMGDLVFYNGTLYVSLANNNTGNMPANNATAYWYPLSGSTAGPPGPPGIMGPTGAMGLNGSAPMYLYGWNGTISYPANSIVTYGNQAYISNSSSISVQPNSTVGNSVWSPLLILTPGPAGPPGAPGSSIPGAPGANAVPVNVYYNWTSSFVYNNADIVLFNNSFYISNLPNNTGVPPSGAGSNSTAHWTMLPIFFNVTAGAPGPPGGPGPVGPPGQPGLEYNSTWSSALTYANGDVVIYNGSMWVSNINSNFNNIPGFANNFWDQLFANQTGPGGPPGPAGQGIQQPVNYSPNATYIFGSLVVYNNQLYFSNCSVNLNQPPNTTNSCWVQIVVQSQPGPTGPPGNSTAGPTGPPGSPGPVGPVGLYWTYLYAYNSSYNYTTDQLVSYNNALYLNNIPSGNINNLPTNSSAWISLIAQTPGPPGPTGFGPPGPQGQTDVLNYLAYAQYQCANASTFTITSSTSSNQQSVNCTSTPYFTTTNSTTFALNPGNQAGIYLLNNVANAPCQIIVSYVVNVLNAPSTLAGITTSLFASNTIISGFLTESAVAYVSATNFGIPMYQTVAAYISSGSVNSGDPPHYMRLYTSAPGYTGTPITVVYSQISFSVQSVVTNPNNCFA